MSATPPPKSLTTPVPANELERLAALYRYKILDTPPEAAFDRITRLAARLFNIPTALISLVDESRAWFKSCVGFGADEVPRDATLCSFALLTDEPLIIPDARLDDRFVCNPFVQAEPGVRFYAGAPLLSHDGFNLGTLCLLDNQPRPPLSIEQQETLVDLAAMVVDELELRLAAHRVAQVDAVLLEVTQGVSAVTGKAFFPALVQHLTKALGTSYACISLLANEYPEALETIAFCAQGQIIDNVEYELQGTPCLEAIRQQKLCYYPQGIQALFPEDHFLALFSIESYAAIPFFDSTGKPLGLLSVMDGKPLENLQLTQSLLTIFAVRIATELERQQVEQERERFFAVTSDLQVMTRTDGYFQWVSPTFERLLGWTVEEMTSRPWTAFVHPDDINPSVSETDSLFSGNETLAFENRYRHKDGSYRWLLWRARPYPEEQIVYGAAVDITDRKQAELEIQKFVSLADNSGEFIGMCDLNFVPFYINSAGQHLVGLDDVQQYIETSVGDFFFPEDQDFIINEFLPRVLQEGQAEVEIRFRHFKTGAPVWMIYNVFYIRGENTQPIGLATVSRNITDRKQVEAALRESENRLRLALESAKLGTWDFNPITGLLQWDQHCKAMFGLSPEAEINYDVFLAGLHPEDRDRIDQMVQHALNPDSDGEYDIEYRTIGIEDGIERWIAAKGKAFSNSAGITIRFIGTVLNITPIKRAEAEREQLLQREQAAREAAEQANQIKDEFLAVLSHELRSPLNPILGWSRLLQQGKLDVAKTTAALATIERNAQLQVQLIDDLLDISRILRGKLSLTTTPVDLSSIISEALETVRLAAEAKAIQIQTTLSLSTAIVLGDAGRLQQVVWNLLSNAIKFTPANGHVTVALSSTGSQAHIQVTDTGKGIKPDFLPYVFEHFRQEDGATTRKFGGLGLGLAIVRQIVELHGGTVAVGSLGEGKGATFTVQLPLAPQLNVLPALKPPPNSTEDLSGICILVVDDEADSREFVAFVLEQAGAIVTTVSSGIEALQALPKVSPDLIVSDIGMPEMDGYMLMRQIHARLEGKQIPAIALTAYAGEVDKQQAIAAGFQRHFSKPIDPEEIMKAISALCHSTKGTT
ncbi:PAS domain S-box protein [Leptolyngbya sp. FACHB-17]|uniref:PAS domain S-box protein n=1 Tax=Leptolyngbyales TaxID=3079749 RepID=UPI00168121AD|nr:PAS domain S-box protein [Leptolyngbya sp. FACHB-17]MBD2082889.1 PAS domain S-box protein [Leptolyngbya sp. FACHB-17]